MSDINFADLLELGSPSPAPAVDDTTPIATPIATGSAPTRPGEIPLGLRDENSPEALAVRRNARVRNAPTPEAIRVAVTASRAGVTALLDEGRAFSVDPANGKLGVIVGFGRRTAEVDPVTLRDRQALILWSDVVSALNAAGLDATILGSAPSDHRHFSDAVTLANNSGFIARAVKAPAACAAQWEVFVAPKSERSTESLPRAFVATLHYDGRIEFDADNALTTTIARDFYRRTGEERITATLLRDRIERALINACRARDCDLGLYVAPSHAATARTLIAALRPIAGRKLYVITPGGPEEIAEGLTVGFDTDIAKLEKDCAESSLSKTVGTNLIGRCETLRQTAQGLAAILGPVVSEGYLVRLRALDKAVMKGMDPRTAHLKDEIEGRN